jgi:hypothetical protein
MTVELVRPDDLLNLTVEWQNLRIDKSDLKNPILVVDNPATSALLTFVFPPQTIAESAFFESSTIPPEGKNRPPDPVGGNDPVTAPGDVAKGAHTTAQLAHSSRLVFSVPDSARIPFTLEGLLDWSKLNLQVNPIAAIPAHPSNSQISSAPGIREPLPTETAIELPYRLVISPNEAVTWQHRGSVFAAGGWAELWHTRLALKAPDGTITDLSRTDTAPLRAIWSPDYNPTKPPKPGDPDDDLGLTAMSKNDRHQIVILTSAFHGYEVEKNVSFEGPFGAVRYHFKGPFVPDPVQAEQLMLSPLGGWLKSRGHWNPPYEVKTVRIGAVGQMFNVGDFLGARDIARQPAAQPARPGIDLRLKLPGTRTEKGEPLDLSEWVHVATQGRDHYVRIVYEGELWPFRHRAALIKITERQFREPPTGGIGAYLIQHMFIVVREPVKTFADDDRAMPLKRVELTTRVTPDIAFPQNITSTQRSFWVEVTTGGAREKFKFHAVAQDAAGRSIDFTTPLVFVSKLDLTTAGMQLVAAEYNAPANLATRAANVPGQKVAFAKPHTDPAKRNDNTALTTESLNFVANESGKPPRLLKADVRIPQVQELLGTDQPTTIRLFKGYVDGDFDAGTGVFAEIASPDGSSSAELGVNFSADKAGGIATPNLGVSALTREHGPVAGNVNDAAIDKFDPGQFFPTGSASLFGSFDLAKLLLSGALGDQAPQMRTATKDVGPDKVVTTNFDWNPSVSNVEVGPAKFMTTNGTHFSIQGEITKVISAGGGSKPGTSKFDGELNEFKVSILDSLTVSFTKFAFTSVNGAKPDVTVALDPGNPIQFSGDLSFVEELRKAIPPGLFGDGPSLDLSPTGIRAGFAVALPPLAVGVFALKDVSLGAALTLPFLDGKPVFDFNVSERAHPFLLTVAIFGGGGFFHLQLDTAGLKALEAALEFGAAAALDIGVASGEVHIMAGIYFSLQRKDPGGELRATLAGYLRMGGSLSVLGLVHISVEFNLTFAYQDVKKAYGRATLTVEVEVAFFHKSVELSVERKFGGESGDPTFIDFYPNSVPWNEYASAFA